VAAFAFGDLLSSAGQSPPCGSRSRRRSRSRVLALPSQASQNWCSR
jgi:hypothetical protein